MPFYAYAISEEDPFFWRFIIVFSTREVADEWWRAIQTAAANKVPGWNTVTRITPQFYTHKPSAKLIRESIIEKNVAAQLSSQIFFQLLNDRDGRLVDIIPTQVTIDHISGKKFKIRSQRDPTLYWKVGSDGVISLSRDDAPTPFVIELRVPPGFSQPTVLIGSDDIIISVPGFSGKGKNVSTDDNSGLILSQHADVFKFSDFIDSFEHVESPDRDLHGKPRHLVFKNVKNLGEAWELV